MGLRQHFCRRKARKGAVVHHAELSKAAHRRLEGAHCRRLVPLRPRDAGTSSARTVAPAGRRTVEIQVLTKPEGATLYVGPEYRGPGGVHLSEPFGTRLEVTCKHPGYKNGVVELVFDGARAAELCILERIVVCIPGVKNPFDQCPD